MSGRVVVVGSVNADVVVRTARLPRPGETVTGSSVTHLPGGKGANQAVAARRAGARVLLVGAVGDDDAGRGLLAFLRAEGVPGVVTVAGPTGTALVTVEDGGDNSIVVVAGANDRVPACPALAPDDVLLLQHEVPPAANAAAVRAARAACARVVLNPAPWRPPDLTGVDVLVVNQSEAAQLGPGTGPAVVTTLGRDGAELRTGGRVSRVPGRSVTAVDATGAGDCFCGNLAAALVRGLALTEAVALANAAAALSVTRAGAAPSMPTLAEVLAR